MSVPAFALPGTKVWAIGLHAGVKRRFVAEVVKLRKTFPRIHVRFLSDEDGNTQRHAIPDLDAYLTMSDVAKYP